MITPDSKVIKDQSTDITTFQFDEPMSLLGLLVGAEITQNWITKAFLSLDDSAYKPET